MKRFIKTFFLFGWLITLTYPVFLLACSLLPQKLRPYLITEVEPTGFTSARFEEAANYKPVDLLILGSSHAYRGFDPRIFEERGISIFNLGTTAQTPIQSELILDTFIDRLGPTMVLLEVYPWGFTSDGVESSIDLIFHGSLLGREKLVRATWDIKVLNSSIYATIVNEKTPEIQSTRDKYIYGGYVERAMGFLIEHEYPTKSWQWNENQFEALSRIVAKCQERNVRIVLVQAPTSQAFYSSYSNNGEFEGRMIEFGEYHNFNGLSALSDSLHFYDEDHLNQDGVYLFNIALLDTLFSQVDLD